MWWRRRCRDRIRTGEHCVTLVVLPRYHIPRNTVNDSLWCGIFHVLVVASCLIGLVTFNFSQNSMSSVLWYSHFTDISGNKSLSPLFKSTIQRYLLIHWSCPWHFFPPFIMAQFSAHRRHSRHVSWVNDELYILQEHPRDRKDVANSHEVSRVEGPFWSSLAFMKGWISG